MSHFRERTDRQGFYVVDLRDIGGGQRTVRGKAAAKALLAKAQARGRAFKRTSFVDVVDDFMSDLDARFERDEVGYGYLANFRTYAAHLKSALALRRDIGDITPGLIKRKVAPALQHGRSPKTLANILGALSLIFDHAVDEGMLPVNPMPKQKRARGRQKQDLVAKIQPATIRAIIAHASPTYRLAIMFAAGTGLRAGEQRALRWVNVDLDAQRVHVSEAVKRGPSGLEVGAPKSAAGVRTVPIGGALLVALQEWKLAQPDGQRGGDLVFPSRTGNFADGGNWRNRGLAAACHAAGVERIRWHDLRHYYASQLLDKFGDNLHAVASIMGHEDIATTRGIYGHWLGDDARDQIIGDDLARAIFD